MKLAFDDEGLGNRFVLARPDEFDWESGRGVAGDHPGGVLFDQNAAKVSFVQISEAQ